MINKGIILAGGTGSRLSPITKSINKQLIPIYDKPLIFYPISTLMLSNIREILIIVNKGKIKLFNTLLGNGSKFGIKIKYKEQNKPVGIPDAFNIGASFIKKSNVSLILGDNFFYGSGLSGLLEFANNFDKGCRIFLKDVPNPESYGVAFLKNKKILNIKEKPRNPLSSKAITGLYFFDNDVIKLTKHLKKSKRGELEITDLIKIYKKRTQLNFTELGRGVIWSDVGKIDDLYNIGNYVASTEKVQGTKIACLEEIALNKKWISKTQIKKNITFYGNNPYSNYLKKLI